MIDRLNTETIEELEDMDCGLPNKENSYLVNRCLTLRKLSIQEFEIEDLRIMIGQQQGLKYLVPLAIQVLNNNILAEGDFYEGDLLQSVLGVNEEFWLNNPQLKLAVKSLVNTNEELITSKRIDFKYFK